MDFQEFEEVSITISENTHQKKVLQEVHSFNCDLCNTRIKGSLLEFRNHISESHMAKEDNLEGTMVNFQGVEKDRGENFLSIDDMWIRIQPEPIKP